MTDKEIQAYRLKTVVSVGIIAMFCVWCGVLAVRQEHEIFIHMGVGLLICMVVFSGIGELATLLMRIIQLLEEEGKK
ncbi:MAG: hypothetical protein EOM68_24895 [Spirochaetia bacterium]|nr:hypothetical protein [Spirochaetia bacterium]